MEIKIDTDYIKLDQLLKLSRIAQSGGEAKIMVLSETVSVNGKLCTERGKKIRVGDLVSVRLGGENSEIRVL